MNCSLTISIYRRPGNRASLVFRRNKVLYRITTIDDAPALVSVFNGYLSDLKRNEAEPMFVFEVLCPRKRNRVVEMGLDGERAHLYVYEMREVVAVPCFKWQGSREVLWQAVSQFSVMAFISRY